MNYGFLVDNTRCIGCHACSTACKSENEVSLGVYRTWVKYTESGAYPDTQRHFQVTRCNHCANPPCVRICPTGAMYQRDDGIVEFDNTRCIGCKACMQACPYDSIHIDPETKTAAKCHYCAHRTDVGLEPACVVVCPTHAILAGDLDDPGSEIARARSRSAVTVRKPEQGTVPNLFYIDGADVNLVPTKTERTPETFMWSDAIPLHGEEHGRPTPQIRGAATAAEQMVQVGYNAQHKVPWHWPVPAYLVTKGIATGAFMLAAFAYFLGAPLHAPSAIAAGVVATVFMLATTALLVYDLERPERFLYILRYPQWRSWLTRGSVLLMGFSTIAGVWPALEVGGALGWVPASVVAAARPWLLGIGAPFALGAAVYTAFLFGQAEGRDLWQSPLLPVHLVVQATMAGAAVMMLVAPLVAMPGALLDALTLTFAVAVVLDLALLFAEKAMRHSTTTAAAAAHAMHHGAYAKHYWLGAIGVGHVFALGLVPIAGPAAAVCALVGLYVFEHAFVMAPQEVPNS